MQIAQIVNSAVSQALTQQMQYIVQHLKSPIKFDVPIFEGERAASWLMWSRRVVCQARACGFEAELTAAKGEEKTAMVQKILGKSDISK